MNFNPLPRKEGDIRLQLYVDNHVISIHSLVKRETVIDWHMTYDLNHFNPLPRKEGDISSDSVLTSSDDFNPLPRKEGDMPDSFTSDTNEVISIHSLVKRETICMVEFLLLFLISIHSLVKRETKSVRISVARLQTFQSTPS